MVRLLAILSVFVLSSTLLRAEELKAVLKKMNANYSSDKAYHVDAEYKLFKGHNSGIMVQKYNGFTENSSSGFYQKIDQSEKISTNKYFLHINHAERAMVFGLPVTRTFNGDVQKALKHASTSVLKENESNFILTFTYSKLTNSEFSRVKMVISKDSYLLKSVDLFYSTFTDFSNDYSNKDLHQSHVRMTFSNYSKKLQLDSSYFKLRNFIVKKDNNMLSTVGRCKGYELVDIRSN
tara:strand:+ start:81934 stop:82641 length:708 start_codon:yes stop_codon:yes gene_type:complete